ncbi:hypothetical protein LTS18_010108, partial [Coniosporium uncinatum]
SWPIPSPLALFRTLMLQRMTHRRRSLLPSGPIPRNSQNRELPFATRLLDSPSSPMVTMASNG